MRKLVFGLAIIVSASAIVSVAATQSALAQPSRPHYAECRDRVLNSGATGAFNINRECDRGCAAAIRQCQRNWGRR